MTKPNGNDENLIRIQEAARVQAEVPTAHQLGEIARGCLNSPKRQLTSEAEIVQLPSNWVSSTGVPKRHAARSEFHGDAWKATGAEIFGMLGTGFLIVLLGGRSCGKTQLGVELIRKSLRRKVQPKFCRSFELFMQLRDAHNEEPSKFAQKMGRYLTDALLVVDQFEMRSLSQFDYEMFSYFLDKRYGEVLDTLICSNHTEEGFRDNVDASVFERIKETGEIIICDWEKFR